MKILPFVLLFTMIACGDKNSQSTGSIIKNEPAPSVPYFVSSPVPAEAPTEVPAVTDPTTDTPADNNPNPEINNPELTENQNPTEPTEPTEPVIVDNDPVTDTDDETPVVVEPTSTKKLCQFSNQRESVSLMMVIDQNSATLLKPEGSNRISFDGFTFKGNVSNSQAAVEHENKDSLTDQGKVLKIQARIVMNAETEEGQLEISLKVKSDDHKIIQTPFEKLADIKGCVSVP